VRCSPSGPVRGGPNPGGALLAVRRVRSLLSGLIWLVRGAGLRGRMQLLDDRVERVDHRLLSTVPLLGAVQKQQSGDFGKGASGGVYPRRDKPGGSPRRAFQTATEVGENAVRLRASPA
jgi:hypothetical protein